MKSINNRSIARKALIWTASVAATLLASVANASVSVASPWWNHRPEPPKELLP